MKIVVNTLLTLTVAVGMFSCSGGAGNVEKEFYVRGNCGMCEERIEKTAREINGVTEADYNVDKELMVVKFDSTKTSELVIHKAIAATGHETDQAPMDEKAHANLPDCCQKMAAQH